MISSFEIVDKRIVPSATGDGPILLVTEPTNEERSKLQSDLQLDDFDFGSMLDPDEVPRVELTPDRTVLIWKLPESAAMSGEIELAVSVVGIVLARERLVLVRRAGGVRFDEREFRRVADAKDVLLSFLLGTVHHFVAHLRVIKQISSELELKITTSMENKYLLQMFSLSESLVYYLDGIEGNAAALARLKSLAKEIGFEKRHFDALDDLMLECAQAARQANIYTSVLSGLMDAGHDRQQQHEYFVEESHSYQHRLLAIEPHRQHRWHVGMEHDDRRHELATVLRSLLGWNVVDRLDNLARDEPDHQSLKPASDTPSATKNPSMRPS